MQSLKIKYLHKHVFKKKKKKCCMLFDAGKENANVKNTACDYQVDSWLENKIWLPLNHDILKGDYKNTGPYIPRLVRLLVLLHGCPTIAYWAKTKITIEINNFLGPYLIINPDDGCNAAVKFLCTKRI